MTSVKEKILGRHSGYWGEGVVLVAIEQAVEETIAAQRKRDEVEIEFWKKKTADTFQDPEAIYWDTTEKYITECESELQELLEEHDRLVE